MSDKVHVPPIKIQGIKTKIVPIIRENVAVDRETVWIEPFMGSGVVGFNVEPEKAIFSDINPCVIDFYNQVKIGTINSYIVRGFLETEGEKLSKYDDEYYYEVRDRFNRDRSALDFLFLNRSCFNGMIRFNKENKFNVPYGHKPQRFAKAYVTKIVNQVRHIEELLAHHDWSFFCRPFEETLSCIPDHSFVYCDPPYIGRHVDYYDSWDEQDEYRLFECLTASRTKFMLSTWDHNQYRKNDYLDCIWGECHKIKVEHYYHVGAKEENRNPMVEALLANYPMTGKDNLLSHENEQLSFELASLVHV